MNAPAPAIRAAVQESRRAHYETLHGKEHAMSHRFGPFALAALAVLSAGCGESPPPREAPPEDKAVVAQAANLFAFDLYERLCQGEGNLFFSPHGVWTVLTMASGGARGETARQMAAALHLPPEREGSADWIHAAAGNVAWDLRHPGRGCELTAANALRGQKDYGFLPEFVALLRTNYGAGLQMADFAGNAEAARAAINDWGRSETRGRIVEAAPADAVNPYTRLVLASAIYFKGQWMNQFQKRDTYDGDFHVAPGKTVRAALMKIEKTKFPYFRGDGFKALEMPYRGETLAMVLFLPDKVDGLLEFEQTFSAEAAAKCIARLRVVEVPVTLPKFRMEREMSLATTLVGMGMPLAFDSQKADFSGMNGGKKPLWIGEVVHKVFVDVNEEGTEAAAVTVGPLWKSAAAQQAPSFIADHPFLFLIRDTRSGCILFMGRLADPKA
jgi:serpin B